MNDIEGSRQQDKISNLLKISYEKLKNLSTSMPLMQQKHGEEEASRREFTKKIKQFCERNLLNEDTASMMEALLEIGKTQVRDIMIPRAQMTIIKENWNLEKILSVILESHHSRYPVFNEEKEEVIGILITKDLLPLLADKYNSEIDLKSILRPVTLVPESKTIDAMLREFKVKRHHMAIVIDEYGAVSGLLTIEDAIEEIVGEIDDEHDTTPETQVRKLNSRIFWVKALMPIEEFNQYFNCELPDEDADTIGGYVLQQFGRMPVNGESLDISERIKITVAKANQRRIFTLKLQIKNIDENTEKDEKSSQMVEKINADSAQFAMLNAKKNEMEGQI